MGWDVFNYIFGVICVIGPIALIFWYAKAFRHRMKEFNERTKDT